MTVDSTDRLRVQDPRKPYPQPPVLREPESARFGLSRATARRGEL